jgi:cytochrome c biogenesis protein CcdA
MKKIILISAGILISLLFSNSAYSQAQTQEESRLIMFFSPSCHECVVTRSAIMPEIEKEFKGRIEIEYRDISDIENYKLLLSLKDKYASKIENVLPVFYFRGHFLNGRGQIKEGLIFLINQTLSHGGKGNFSLPSIDLVAYFKTFRTIGIVVAGLEDGINPCAFTVIVFFISYLALQGYKKKQLVAIGLAFILAVFITYTLIGIGIFNIIYKLEKFVLAARIFNIVIGVFSVILGAITIYDVFKFKKTGQTDGMVLQLPKSVKNQIHSVIGMHYRKPKDEAGAGVESHTFKLIIAAFVTGFLVSFLELVCTGQLYLPTIKFVLKTTPYKFQALLYLVLYNLMFITPLVIIFLFALLGVTSEQFSRILKKHLLTVKIMMAVLFIGLGVFLLWRP